MYVRLSVRPSHSGICIKTNKAMVSSPTESPKTLEDDGQEASNESGVVENNDFRFFR